MTTDLPARGERARHGPVELLATIRSLVRARFELRGTTQGPRVRCHGPMLIEGREGIVVGSRAVFLGGMFPTELRCEPGAELVIGERSTFNYGVSIVARSSVRIGARCMFGSLVHVRDFDGRRTAKVTIGDDVWVAHGAILEPGATIGDGSVVAAGAVVSGVVPPGMLAVGNPAQWVPLEGPRPSSPSMPPAPASMPAIAPVPSAPSLSSPSLSSPSLTPSRHSRDEVRAAIIEWLDDTRHFGEAATLITSDTMPLRDNGVLDSLGLVQLVLMLEKRFGTTIDRDLLAQPESQTMHVLLDLVSQP